MPYPAELVNIQFYRPNDCVHQHLLQEYGFTILSLNCIYPPPPPPPLIALAAVRSKN